LAATDAVFAGGGDIWRLLCLLQVVVPVRETAAQALGAALQPADVPSLQRVMQLLTSMHQHHEWSVRHGAYTGIKYLLASRPEAAEELLPAALPVLITGLQDKDDSVQAAAADALVPMAPLLLSIANEQV
jgi:TATA-binding protein-associated factor